MRPSGRAPDAIRSISFTRNYTVHPEGSVLVEYGQTRVLCNATVEEKVPPLVAEGGYIPLADGRVRVDVPFENYVYYRQLLGKVTQVC